MSNKESGVSFESLFSDVRTTTIATRQYGNTLESARGKVINSLQGSKALFDNRSYKQLKHGKAVRPVPCFVRQDNGNYFLKVLFSRVTLKLPNGENAIECAKKDVPEMHDRLIKLVSAGLMDGQIKEAQEKYRAAQDRQPEEA